MDESFNFESQYRITKDLKMVGFRTKDDTEWTISEEWLLSQTKPRVMLQRVIFTKENHYERNYFITMEISSVNSRVAGEIKAVAKSKHILTKIVVPLEEYKVFRYSVYETREEHNVLIADRALTDLFRYKVTISPACVLESGGVPQQQAPTGDRLMMYSDQILSLLETGSFSDVVLTDGKSKNIRAHRNILCARSVLFRAMFKHNMQESKDGIVYITDIDFSVLQEMVRYMYSGVLRSIDVTLTHDLFVAADKYNLQELKVMCTNLMERHLTVHNILCITRLACAYREVSLQHACHSFLVENFGAMDNRNDDWLSLETNYPDFCHDVLESHSRIHSI